MTATDPYADDPVVQKLEDAIWAFLLVKSRYPVLTATARAVDALRARADLRDRSPNGLIFQILRDSFDMLVIDLYSIREATTARQGLFDLLKQSPERLHVTPCATGDEDFDGIVNDGFQKAQEWLVGTAAPATADAIVALCSRLRDGTKPLDADRNRVRAHRYENRGEEVKTAFPSLPDLKDQIDLIWGYLHRLYLVLTGRSYSEDLHVGNTDGTAEDLADLVTHGSINQAVTYYGMAEVTSENPHPWYWKAREDTLKTSEPSSPINDHRP